MYEHYHYDNLAYSLVPSKIYIWKKNIMNAEILIQVFHVGILKWVYHAEIFKCVFHADDDEGLFLINEFPYEVSDMISENNIVVICYILEHLTRYIKTNIL
jgi:hypothetical protein